MNLRTTTIAVFVLLSSSLSIARAESYEAIMNEMMQKRNERALETYTKELNLTPEQQTTVKTALQNQSDTCRNVLFNPM